MPDSAADHFRIPSLRDRVSDAEWQARIDLAACYRLMEIYGMSDMGANHVSLAVPGEEGAFLINSYGMLYEEITASSLQKIDVHGNVLMNPGPSAIGTGLVCGAVGNVTRDNDVSGWTTGVSPWCLGARDLVSH